MFGRAFKDELDREQSWLREHEGEYLVACEWFNSLEAVRLSLDGCALALATLGCLTNETSPVMAGHVIGTAESQLEAALKNRATIHTYESRKANYEQMQEHGSPLPDLGLGALHPER